MNKIQYPQIQDLRWWIGIIESENLFLKPYLPKVDTEWSQRVLDKISLISGDLYLKQYGNDVYSQAALIFYKINKAHNEIDSNKRTAIIVTYLFLFLNNLIIHGPKEVRIFALRIAKSKGRKNQDTWIDKIRTFLVEKSVKLP